MPIFLPDEKRDAYIDWGFATSFRYFFVKNGATHTHIGLLLEWKSSEDARSAAQLSSDLHVHVAAIYSGTSGTSSEGPQKIWAVSVKKNHLAQYLEKVDPYLRRVELASPVTPGPPLILGAGGPQSQTPTLAGVLDDGCAFANAKFASSQSTRVIWLWNQDPTAVGTPLDGVLGPQPGLNFNYGAQLDQKRLNNLIAANGVSQNQIYSGAGLSGLRRSFAHGTHVMDLLCGETNWDIAFVQFPVAAIADPSGRWLGRYALDGLHYVLGCAGPNTTMVVVNISWGPQTGPHDGSSILETAIDGLISSQPPGRRLIVTLPAGNSYSARAHAVIAVATGGKLYWNVPPDGETPAFLEIWWPKSVLPSAVKLTITPPFGLPLVVSPGANATGGTWYVRLKQLLGQGAMALVVVHPTRGPHAGQAGRWTIEFDPVPSGAAGNIDAYVARVDPNMGAPNRGLDSYLSDDALLTGRFVSPEERYQDVAGSCIRRHGTLNGIGTGSKTMLAAGYTYFERRLNTAYSSAGPSRGTRSMPNYSCVTDQSLAVPGVRASGVRSGSTFMLVGTSTAAPQLGRQLVNGPVIAVKPQPYDAERVGNGCLVPTAGIVETR